MNPIAEALTDGLMAREQEVGASIHWSGTDYPCSGGEQAGDKVLGYGGYTPGTDVTIIARASVFAQAWPEEEQDLIYKSTPEADPVSLRFKSRTVLHDEILIFECYDPAKGS
jgi:hypothetical protein